MVFIICISSQNDSKEKKGTETSIKTFFIKHDVYDNISYIDYKYLKKKPSLAYNVYHTVI